MNVMLTRFFALLFQLSHLVDVNLLVYLEVVEFVFYWPLTYPKKEKPSQTIFGKVVVEQCQNLQTYSSQTFVTQRSQGL